MTTIILGATLQASIRAGGIALRIAPALRLPPGAVKLWVGRIVAIVKFLLAVKTLTAHE